MDEWSYKVLRRSKEASRRMGAEVSRTLASVRSRKGMDCSAPRLKDTCLVKPRELLLEDQERQGRNIMT
jgi:hypothetical protein